MGVDLKFTDLDVSNYKQLVRLQVQ